MKRVSYEEMVREFHRVLVKKGFTDERAEAAAEIFAQNSLAGVYSHGLNRFPRVVEYLEKGALERASRFWPAECKACDGSGVCTGKGVRHRHCSPGK